jgi:hypothetical protein
MGKNWKYDDCLGCTIAKIDQDDAVYGMNAIMFGKEITRNFLQANGRACIRAYR